MKKQFFSFALAGILMLGAVTGCRKDKPEGSDPSGRIAVNLKADIVSPSKLKVADDQFQTSDKVGLFMKEAGESMSTALYEDAINVEMGIDGQELKATPPVLYPLTGNVDFIAYYPYVSTSSMGAGYTIDVDVAGQTGGLPTEALYSNNVVNQAPTSSAVTLNFKYSLAKFVVTVTEVNSYLTASDFSAMTVSVDGMNTQATLQLADGALVGQTGAQAIGLHRSASDATSATFDALVLPTAGGMTFSFTVGGETYSCAVDQTIVAATQYNFTFVIDALSPDATVTLLNAVIIPRDEVDVPPIVVSSGPTYIIKASALTSFGSSEEGYTQPAPQTVTVTNIGTEEVTLTQPTATNYYIGTLSETVLAAGETATFTVQPKEDLPAGNYDEIIAISGSDGTSASVDASFTVTPASSGPTAVVRYVKPTASGLGDGTSWDNASGDIQAMVNASGVGEQVWIAGGTYSLAATLVMKDGVDVYGGFAGSETGVSQRAKGSAEPWEFTNATVLNGQGARRVLVQGTGGSGTVANTVPFDNLTTWDGVTIINGKVTATGGAGVVLNTNGKLINCIISDNVTDFTGSINYGGGVKMHGESFLSHSKIANNTCLITSANTDVHSRGGGIYTTDNSTVTHCLIANNTLTRREIGTNVSGGGIYCNVATAVVANCIITGNSLEHFSEETTANLVRGGGVSGLGTYINCTIADNSINSSIDIAGSSGVQGVGATTILINCIIYGNTGGTNQFATGTVSYSAVEGQTVAGTDNVNLASSPFVNAAGGNYRLAGGTNPCVDAGNNGAANLPEYDFEGNARVNGTVDMGAYERQ